jgi:cytochrome c oxidase subunit 4
MTTIDSQADIDTHDDAHGHPSDRNYVIIALILGALTALEILMFVFESELPRGLVKIGLIALMGVKFWIVGAYFMHLKFDNPILWRLFGAGLFLAVVVYFIMLSAFEFSFWNDGFDDAGLPGGGS